MDDDTTESCTQAWALAVLTVFVREMVAGRGDAIGERGRFLALDALAFLTEELS